MCRNLVIGLIIFTPLWVNEIWQDNFDTSCLLNYPKNVLDLSNFVLRTFFTKHVL